MKWQYVGPKLTKGDVAAFEARIGQIVPDPICWFLLNLVNGGMPACEAVVQVHADPLQEVADVHGLYGIDHAVNSFNLLTAFEDLPVWRTDQGWPPVRVTVGRSSLRTLGHVRALRSDSNRGI